MEDLRSALGRREFRLLFQPIVELETGRVSGMEALLRWHRPKRGVVAPLDFVALAEDAGVTLPLGRWVVQEVCRYAHSWLDTARLPISVNLFARHFGHSDVVDEVLTAIQDSRVPTSGLVLEISERVIMKNIELSKVVLQRLRDAGVAVYMDDFGVAASSLTYLSQLPLQGIKVDRSLVHRVGGRRIDLDLVRSMVDLARGLGLRVIAVGVETVAQRERLIAFGCELGQGHLFAKPLEPKATDAFLAKSVPVDRRSA